MAVREPMTLQPPKALHQQEPGISTPGPKSILSWDVGSQKGSQSPSQTSIRITQFLFV